MTPANPNSMTSRQRMAAVLEHRLPDRVPVAELWIDPAIGEAICPGGTQVDVADELGLDMVAVPGDTSAETIAALIADEMAIGVINKKATAARIIPVPGKKAGERAGFGGLLGESVIMAVNNGGGDNAFIRRGGLIPAPIHSLTN